MKALLTAFALFISSALSAQTDSLPPRIYNWDSLKPKKEESGIRREILEGSTTSLTHFEIHASTLESAKISFQQRPQEGIEELVIIKEGLLKVTIKDTTKTLGRGSIVFIMPNDAIRIENIPNSPATYYVLSYQSKPGNMEWAKQNGESFMLDWNTLPMTKD